MSIHLHLKNGEEISTIKLLLEKLCLGMEAQERGDIYRVMTESHCFTKKQQHCKAIILQLKKIFKGEEKPKGQWEKNAWM